MSGLFGTIMENSFNVGYLLTVWILVILMASGWKRCPAADRPLAGRFLLAFLLLALGDTFHVGARVLVALVGAGQAVVAINGVRSSLLGLGMLATAYTMTLFYMVLADARVRRAGRGRDAAFWLMQGLLVLRLILMALPGNGWELSAPPYVMGLLRNAPLALAGVLLASLVIREGRRDHDPTWTGIGWAMVASYAFYVPVILFANLVPLLGLLMIPKTVAYLVMGFLALKRYWPRR